VLGTAVLSFVLLQDEYKSVLLSCVFQTAIATVGCRCCGDLPKLFSFDPLCFAVIDRNVYCMARLCILFAIIHNYAGRSDSLGIIGDSSPCRRKGLPEGSVAHRVKRSSEQKAPDA
jgi:hypothetical protein